MSAPQPKVRPRHPLHAGVVDAGGLFLGSGLLSGEAQRRRALALWAPGVLVYTIDIGLVVRLHAPKRLDARRAPGLPLVWRDGRLSSAPLRDDEWASLAAPKDSAVIVEGGEARVYALGALRPESPARWLDVGAWEVARVSSLAPAPPAPKELAPTARPMRGALGLEAPPSVDAQREAAILALRGERPALPSPQAPPPQGEPPWLARLNRWLTPSTPSTPDAPPSPSVPPAEAPGVALVRAPSAGQGVLSRLGRWLGQALGDREGARRPTPPPNKPTPPRPAPVTVERPSPPGVLARLQAWARAQAEQAQRQEELGAAQARYVEEMMELFRRGELNDALRRAIPLSDGVAAPGATQAQVGAATPRGELRISQREGGTPSHTVLGVYDELRRLYRASFEALAQEGRVEEAAYVLVELLGQDQEGISFLEAHGRYAMAAEVAEARKKDPAQVVRLWLLAGETAQALRVARRSGAFGSAEALLKQKDGEAWKRWRLAWAEHRAKVGDFGQATELVWPIEEARPLGLAWLERLVGVGGAVGGHALARRMELSPGTSAQDLAVARAWFDAPKAENREARRAFAGVLLNLGHDEARGWLAKRAARVFLAEHHQTQDPRLHELARKLAVYACDPALNLELSQAPKAPEPLPDLSQPLRLERADADAGVLEIHDVLRGLDGRFLLALGEAGAVLCSPQGKIEANFSEPTHSLVSAGGLRAVGLAPRDKLWRLSRFDLEAREASAWCHAPLDRWAEESDGGAWYVAQGDRLLALDLTTPGEQPSVLWQAPGLGGRTQAMCWKTGRCALVLQVGPAWEFWSFQAPSMVLERRTPIELAPPAPATQGEVEAVTPRAWLASEAAVAFSQQHEVARYSPDPDSPRLRRDVLRRWELAQVWRSSEQTPSATGEAQEHTWPLAQGGPWTVFAEALPDQTGLRVCAVYHQKPTLTQVAEVVLGGSRRACARFEGELLLLADDRGRVMWLDLARRALVGEFRA